MLIGNNRANISLLALNYNDRVGVEGTVVSAEEGRLHVLFAAQFAEETPTLSARLVWKGIMFHFINKKVGHFINFMIFMGL